MRPAKSSLLLILLICLNGCSLFTRPIFDTRGFRAATPEEVAVLNFELEKTSAKIESLRSLWDVSFKRLFSSDKVKQSLIFKRPDKLRAEYFERATNQLLFIMVMNQGQLKAYDYRDNTAFIGPATRHELARLLSIPLNAEEIMLFFAGSYAPPIEMQLLSLEAWINQRSNKAMLEFIYLDDTRVKLLLDRQFDSRLEAARVHLPDGDYITITYQYTAESNYPSKIILHVEARSVDIISSQERFVLNPEFRNEELLFDFLIPAGAKVYFYDSRSLSD